MYLVAKRCSCSNQMFAEDLSMPGGYFPFCELALAANLGKVLYEGISRVMQTPYRKTRNPESLDWLILT